MYTIGVDLGGTKMSAGLVDEKGRLLYKNTVSTGMAKTSQQILNELIAACNDLVEKNHIAYTDISFVGVGLPGAVNFQSGTIENLFNLQFKNIDLSGFLKNNLPVPVYIDNDANCAALAENIWGAAKGRKSAVMVTVGTGVGGGIVINGKIWNGEFFTAGEIGHHVIVADGVPCNCGRAGCFEKYASASALSQWGMESAKNNNQNKIFALCDGNINSIDAKLVFAASDLGDKDAVELTQKFYKYLALGLTNIINILRPQAIVIGGGISERGEKLITPLKSIINEMQSGFGGLQTEIFIASLGNDSGIIGAAMLGRPSPLVPGSP